MEPEDLKRLNIEHFERLLRMGIDIVTRRTVERLLEEERAKDASAYTLIRPREDGHHAAP
jgi:hypothetical protein